MIRIPMKDAKPAWIPLILLCCVALNQLYWSNFHDLSPWKGGGFGMFSHIDSPSSRLVEAYVVVGEKKEAVDIPSWLKSDIERLKTFPTSTRARALAGVLAAQRWGYLVLAPPNSQSRVDVQTSERWLSVVKDSGAQVPIEAVEVSIYRVRFSSQPWQLTKILLFTAKASTPS